MTTRANYIGLAPKAMQILMNQEAYLRQQFSESDTLSMALWELVKLRVSQINQCAFCIDMHSKDALAQGETLERIVGLSAWRDMPAPVVHHRRKYYEQRRHPLSHRHPRRSLGRRRKG
ncbi:carboxymuconolactone decarboxylase family protein [Marinobacter sp. OP 3.4]|uniref:carboxymuconolactone decarboxylase family protein n=1 Tax=Marinobacter sp. OP 3.4 TaxID=3076501 RepID=UPI002E21C4ED